MKRIKVAFIAHPFNLSTLSIISGWPKTLLNAIGRNRIKKYLVKKKPFVFNEIQNLKSKTGAKIDLVGIACPLLPDQMVSLNKAFVVGRIIESVKLAKRKGADIVALGGFTSVIGNEGEDVAKSIDIAVTSGNTFTAGLAIAGINTAVEAFKLPHIHKCVVIGATGDIGQACAYYFMNKVDHLACIARDDQKLQKLQQELSHNCNARISCHKSVREASVDADVIISATSALTTIIDADSLKPGAIVCDIALPANIAREVARKRKDVLVFEGGLSKVPFISEVNDTKWNNLMPKNAIYGCLAEGLVLAFEGKIENFSIGRGNITQEKIRLIMGLAHKHGFQLSDYFCGDKFYNEIDLRLIREIAARARLNIRTSEEAVI